MYAEINSNVNYMFPILNNAQMIVSTLADNGTLLTADLMRPTWGVVTMVRNIPSIVFGLLLYVGLIRGILWLAVKQAIRRGMLPEMKRAWQSAKPLPITCLNVRRSGSFLPCRQSRPALRSPYRARPELPT